MNLRSVWIIGIIIFVVAAGQQPVNPMYQFHVDKIIQSNDINYLLDLKVALKQHADDCIESVLSLLAIQNTALADKYIEMMKEPNIETQDRNLLRSIIGSDYQYHVNKIIQSGNIKYLLDLKDRSQRIKHSVMRTEAEAYVEWVCSLLAIQNSQLADNYNQHRNLEVEKLKKREFKRKIRVQFKKRIRKVQDDGNCLFRAVARQFQVHRISSHTRKEVRAKAVHYMRTHPDKFVGHFAGDDQRNSFDQHVAAMEKDMTFGTYSELVAIASVYRIQIKLYSYEGIRPIGSMSDREIELAFTGPLERGHFDSIEAPITTGK